MFVPKFVVLFRCSLIACLIVLNAAKPDTKNSDITFVQIKPVIDPIPIVHRQQRQEQNMTPVEKPEDPTTKNRQQELNNQFVTTEKPMQDIPKIFVNAERPSLKQNINKPHAKELLAEESSINGQQQQQNKKTSINTEEEETNKESTTNNQANIQELTTPLTITTVKPTLYIQKAKESSITKQQTILNSTHVLSTTTPLPILHQDQNNYKRTYGQGTVKPIVLISNVPLKPKKSVDFRPSKRYINIDGGISRSPSVNRVDLRKYKSKCRCARIWNCPKLQISVPRCQPDYYMCCF